MAKPPAPAFDVGELPGDGDASAVDAAVLVVIPGSRGERLSGPVEGVPLGAGGGGDQGRSVVEAEAAAADFVQPRHHHGVDEQPAERLAPGRRPPEHSGELSPPAVTPERPRAAGEAASLDGALRNLPGETVDGGVAPGCFLRGQDIPHHEVPPQVEEIPLFRGHPAAVAHAVASAAPPATELSPITGATSGSPLLPWSSPRSPPAGPRGWRRCRGAGWPRPHPDRPPVPRTPRARR